MPLGVRQRPRGGTVDIGEILDCNTQKRPVCAAFQLTRSGKDKRPSWSDHATGDQPSKFVTKQQPRGAAMLPEAGVLSRGGMHGVYTENLCLGRVNPVHWTLVLTAP